jgi:hypothetical protein
LRIVTVRADGRQEQTRGDVTVLGWRAVATARDLAARLGVLGSVLRARDLRADRRRAARVQTVVPEILSKLVAASGAPNGAWQINNIVHTVSDVIVVNAGPAEQASSALIKVAETPAASDGLRWQHEALTVLKADERLGSWRELLPGVLDAGEIAGSAYLVETRVAGVPLEHALRDPFAEASALRDAASAIGLLHSATAHETTIGHEQLDRWVREPARVLADVANQSGARRSAAPQLERLTAELCGALEGRQITVSWVHGDYGPGNILTDAAWQISGIVDWEFAQPEDFPSLDIVTLLLTTRMYVRRQELGRVVCDLVLNPEWSSSEAALAAAAPDAETCASIGIDRVVLLCWLRHTAWMITRCSRYAASGLWLHTNIHTVLDSLSDR